jgi:hypothetical protein
MKRLNVPFRFRAGEVEDEIQLHIEGTLPLSDGFYYVRQFCFAFVSYKSTIYWGSATEWLSDFALLDHKPLRDVEYETLQKLVKLGIANKENKELLDKEEHWREIRNLVRDTKKICIRVINKKEVDKNG